LCRHFEERQALSGRKFLSIEGVDSIAMRDDELVYSKNGKIFIGNRFLAENGSKIRRIACENAVKDNLFALSRNEIIIYSLNARISSLIGKIPGQFDGISVSENVIVVFNRKISLFDLKSNEKIVSFESGLKTNDLKVSGNLIVSANEDYNAYLHDMRYLKNCITFRGHVNSVLSVDIKGTQIATGSYDKTIRLFQNNLPAKNNDISSFGNFDNCYKSRDIYHSRRMEAVNRVAIKDNFIFSASEDGSVRMWRLYASQKEVACGKQKRAIEYSKQVKNKFAGFKDVKRIDNHRFLPKNLKGLIKTNNEMIGAKLRKERRRNK
ncbi:Protein SOF1, partial [Dictyocoela roeselum]